MGSSSDPITATPPEIWYHVGTSAYPRGAIQIPALKPTSQLANQEACSAFSSHRSQFGNPIRVMLGRSDG
ncbi:hypothetical protein I79_001995 [Cricetulus griseus]|uniref:Uncharacterized protein n=1 Tax=Cricetulus griseus TaxID=10029 RepID=G3GW78_CRIGR|nr:hypothetical protein I79_001995 [Cricetulus griseus]